MVNIIICDDDENITTQYSSIISKIALRNNIEINIKTLANGEQLFFHLEESPNSCDVIFLDILMGEINGIETAKKLRDIGCEAQIIFLTTSDEYVFDAFEVSPLNYLVKENVNDEVLEKTFLKACKLANRNDVESYPIEKNGNIIRVPFNQIDYFEVRNRIVTCNLVDKKIDFYYKLDDIELELSEKGFIRCHRAFIVNIKSIANIENNQLILKDKKTVPLSTRKYGEVKKAFTRYIRRHI